MNLAARIDHTLLAPEASRPDVHRIVAEALQYGFASVCVAGVYVGDVATALRGSGVKTCGVVGFPHGTAKASAKAIEATILVKDGAQELDFVAHLPAVIRGDVAAMKGEFLDIVKAARSASPQVIVKVILETAAIHKAVGEADFEARIAAVCQAARESGIDFVKTSTGYHAAGGATVQAVRLMKKHSQGLHVKASGGIRTYDDAMAMFEAGADRLGCSAGVAIVTGATTKGAAGTGGY